MNLLKILNINRININLNIIMSQLIAMAILPWHYYILNLNE